MPKISGDVISTSQSRRLFLQPGGPKPNNPVRYAGLDAQYLMLDGVTRPISGGIESIQVPDPFKVKRFVSVGRKVTAPALPTATLHALEKHGPLPWQLGEIPCPFNVYLLSGQCQDLSDFLNGWGDFVEIYSLAEATEIDMGARTAWSDDNQIEDAISLTLDKIYPVGSINVSEEASTQVDKEAVDGVFGSEVECGNCGPADDGTQKAYVVVKSSGGGSPGLPAELIYTLDSGLNWSQVNINGFGATEDPLAVGIVGDKIVVLGDGAYYWAVIDADTGIPGTFTKVTTGFVANKDPLDLYVLSPREVFFCGEGGYIYRATDITAGVSVMDAGDATTSNLFRIDGDKDEVIVSVGSADTVIRSLDRGVSWGATIDSPVGIAVDLISLAVKSKDEIWVGCGVGCGRIYYTLNGGASWTEKHFSGEGAGLVRDIVFATEEVGFFVHDDATPTGRIHCTWNGGADWARQDSGGNRILNWPTVDRINRIAVPHAGAAVDANNILCMGLAGNGTDGVVLLGKAGVL